MQLATFFIPKENQSDGNEKCLLPLIPPIMLDDDWARADLIMALSPVHPFSQTRQTRRWWRGERSEEMRPDYPGLQQHNITRGDTHHSSQNRPRGFKILFDILLCEIWLISKTSRGINFLGVKWWEGLSGCDNPNFPHLLFKSYLELK